MVVDGCCYRAASDAFDDGPVNVSNESMKGAGDGPEESDPSDTKVRGEVRAEEGQVRRVAMPDLRPRGDQVARPLSDVPGVVDVRRGDRVRRATAAERGGRRGRCGSAADHRRRRDRR